MDSLHCLASSDLDASSLVVLDEYLSCAKSRHRFHVFELDIHSYLAMESGHNVGWNVSFVGLPFHIATPRHMHATASRNPGGCVHGFSLRCLRFSFEWSVAPMSAGCLIRHKQHAPVARWSRNCRQRGKGHCDDSAFDYAWWFTIRTKESCFACTFRIRCLHKLHYVRLP